MIKTTMSLCEVNVSHFLHNHMQIYIIALNFGAIMGILGAGGGFLIIPILILYMGFTMLEAVPTSLFIITMNSFMGFSADQYHLIESEWILLFKYLGCSLVGMLIGTHVAKCIKVDHLKKYFGYFLWTIAIAIFSKDFIFIL